MNTLPTNVADAIVLLQQLERNGREWHLDDDPFDTVRARTGERFFNDEEAAFCEALVPRLNELFARYVPDDERHCINAGAWTAAALAGWVSLDEEHHARRHNL
jgi:hypothetical protein